MCTSVNQRQAQGPKLLPQLEPLLSPQLSLLDLLLLRAAGPALKENRPSPGPAPCVAGDSSAATKACRTATSLHDRETGWGWGKAQVNTAALRPMRAGGGCCQRAGWRGPRGLREGKGSIQHIQIRPRHRWEGWARPTASSSSRQMARIFLEFPGRWVCRPQRCTDPQVAAQVSG